MLENFTSTFLLHGSQVSFDLCFNLYWVSIWQNQEAVLREQAWVQTIRTSILTRSDYFLNVPATAISEGSYLHANILNNLSNTAPYPWHDSTKRSWLFVI